MKKLFSNPATIKTFQDFNNKFQDQKFGSEFENKRNHHTTEILKYLISGHDTWDENCQFNIGYIGDQLVQRIELADKKSTTKELDEIASSLFRLIIELDLTMENDISNELQRIKLFFLKNKDSFTDSARDQIEYASLSMPIQIMKRTLHHRDILAIKNLTSKLNEAEKINNEWDGKLDDRTSKVNALSDSLKKYENAFNFVGLYRGFDDLSSSKKWELRINLLALWGLALLTLAPAIFELDLIMKHSEDLASIKDLLWVSLLPMISIAALLIYYFRVLLSNYKSIKSQLLQIELRKTLCRFIQSYSDFAKEMKDKDSDSLAKFESVIFAGIVSGDDKLPSTYDGLEQFSTLIKSLKS